MRTSTTRAPTERTGLMRAAVQKAVEVLAADADRELEGGQPTVPDQPVDGVRVKVEQPGSRVDVEPFVLLRHHSPGRIQERRARAVSIGPEYRVGGRGDRSLSRQSACTSPCDVRETSAYNYAGERLAQ